MQLVRFHTWSIGQPEPFNRAANDRRREAEEGNGYPHKLGVWALFGGRRKCRLAIMPNARRRFCDISRVSKVGPFAQSNSGCRSASQSQVARFADSNVLDLARPHDNVAEPAKLRGWPDREELQRALEPQRFSTLRRQATSVGRLTELPTGDKTG